jgi:hypothetical protein
MPGVRKFNMRCQLLFAALLLALDFRVSVRAAVSFSTDIAPLLVQKCLTCHNAEKEKGKYRLDSFSALLKPGESKSPPIVPGAPEESHLYQLITAKDPDDRMPQKDEPLPAEQIARIAQWIKEGAKCDRPGTNELLTAFVPRSVEVKTPERYAQPTPVLALAFNPSAPELAASGYGEVTIWNANDGALLRRIGGLPEKVSAMAYDANSRLVLCGGTPGISGELMLVESSGRPRKLAGAADVILDLELSPDGKTVATAGADNSIRLYDFPSGRERLVIQQHADWVNAIAFSGDGRQVASASRDRTCRIFETATGDLETTYTGHDGPVQAIAFGRNDKVLYSSARDRKIHVWTAKEGKKTNEIAGADGEILNLKCFEDRLLCWGADKTIREYTLKGEKRRIYSGHRDWVYALAIEPSQRKTMATGAFDGEVRIWDLDTGNLLRSFRALPGLETVHEPR